MRPGGVRTECLAAFEAACVLVAIQGPGCPGESIWRDLAAGGGTAHPLPVDRPVGTMLAAQGGAIR